MGSKMPTGQMVVDASLDDPCLVTMPRILQIGQLTLDLFHRDGQVDGNWLGLFPREFEVLWRLAESSGAPVTKQQFLQQVWRLENDPLTNRLEVCISRIRSKLHVFRLSGMVETVEGGGYRISPGG